MIEKRRVNNYEEQLVESSYSNCGNICGNFNYLFCMMEKIRLSIHTVIVNRKCNVYCVIFALFVYLTNKFILSELMQGVAKFFCNSYLNDLFCPLFFLAFANMWLIWAEYEMNTYKICVIVGMIAGLIWEYFAPIINSRAVSDPVDIVCYFVGTNLYYFVLRFEINKRKSD